MQFLELQFLKISLSNIIFIHSDSTSNAEETYSRPAKSPKSVVQTEFEATHLAKLFLKKTSTFHPFARLKLRAEGSPSVLSSRNMKVSNRRGKLKRILSAYKNFTHRGSNFSPTFSPIHRLKRSCPFNERQRENELSFLHPWSRRIVSCDSSGIPGTRTSRFQ